jgi:hypothetical protein
MATETTHETQCIQKTELIDLVERTDLPLRVTLRQPGIAPRTFYGWYKRYLEGGFDALHDKAPSPRPRWNKVPDKVWAEQGMTHTRGRPYHPQTQGKIERYHRSMKNVVKLQHYYFPWELQAAVRDFVSYYNHRRDHESLDSCTPADVYYGRQSQVLSERNKIKQLTLQRHKKEYRAANAA